MEILAKQLGKKQLYVKDPGVTVEVVGSRIELRYYNGVVLGQERFSNTNPLTVHEESYFNEFDDEDYDIDYAMAAEDGTLPKYVVIDGICVYFE